MFDIGFIHAMMQLLIYILVAEIVKFVLSSSVKPFLKSFIHIGIGRILEKAKVKG
jgi:hypothetical protein